MKMNYVLTIKAEERTGLLNVITGMINKKQIPIKSLSAAATDVHDIILITVEVFASESALTSLAFKLENIIEIFAVEVQAYDKVLCLRAAYFKMAKTFLETPKMSALQRHSAIIVNVYPDSVLVAKYGTDAAIRSLYNELEGIHLLGFSQTGLISDSCLIGGIEARVMSINSAIMLAA